MLLKVAFGNVSSAHLPTGGVQINLGSNTIATGAITSGSASFTVSLPEGTDGLTAVYAGDSNYLSATSSMLVVSVTPAVSSTAVALNPTSSTYGGSVSLTATVTSSYTGAVPTGFIQFYSGSVLLGTQPLTGASASLSSNAIPGGTDFVTAHNLGDSNFAASTSGSKSIVIARTTPSLTLGSSANTTSEGASITLSAVLGSLPSGSGVAYPTGTVKFSLGNTTLGAVTPNNGQATLQLTTLPAGSDSILASYGGDTNFEPAKSSPVVVTVSKGTSSVRLTPLANTTQVGQAFTLIATVSGGGIPPSGKVTFYNGSTSLGSATLASGLATISPSLPAGSDSLTVTYAGDTNYSGSSSGAVIESVSRGAPRILLSASPSTASAGANVTFTVNVSLGTTLEPGGNVSISCNGPFINTSPVAVTNGVATFSTTTLKSGYYPCEAIYSGDGNFNGGNSNVIYVSIN